MKHTPPRRRVHIRADDPTLTPFAGLVVAGELVHRLGLIRRLDTAIDAVRPFKQRRRGRSAGELLVALAESILAGGSHLAHLDVLRQDTAGAALRAVAAVPAPPTAGQLLRRFTRRQCHAAVATVAAAGNAFDAELGLDPHAPITLDGDATHTEVYGRQKEGAAFNYEGRRGYATQAVTWAERQRVLAAELLCDNAAPTRSVVALLRRALRALPVAHGPVAFRADSDYYTLDLLHACRRQHVRFAVSVPRSPAMWHALERIRADAWQPAVDMPGAEVAVTTYTPGGWRHEPMRLLIRRVPCDAAALSRSPRSRRRRTIPADQLALALAGDVAIVSGYSFILTDRLEPAAVVEQWQRQRAAIEERFRDAKLGCGLLHLPLGTVRANAGWLVATVLATNWMAMLSATVRDVAPTADDPRRAPGYRTSPILRRWLIATPGRLVRAARQVHLRLPRGWWWADVFTATYARLRLLAPT